MYPDNLLGILDFREEERCENGFLRMTKTQTTNHHQQHHRPSTMRRDIKKKIKPDTSLNRT